MTVSKKKITLWALLTPVMCFICYHDIYLFCMTGQENIVKEAIRDAVFKSGRPDLELSHISKYSCDSSNMRFRHHKVRIYNCSASAVFDDGASADVSIEKREFTQTRQGYGGGKSTDVYRITFTVTVHGLGPDMQGEASISDIFI